MSEQRMAVTHPQVDVVQALYRGFGTGDAQGSRQC
jgi:hypothetical protein